MLLLLLWKDDVFEETVGRSAVAERCMQKYAGRFLCASMVAARTLIYYTMQPSLPAY